MAGHEPTKEQCKEAAQKAVEVSRMALEERGIGWDLLAGKLKEELSYEEPTIVKQYRVVQEGKKGKEQKKVVAFHKKINLKTPAAMVIRQKARISAHELSGHFPPKETRIAGPGGGPIPLQKLEIEFVKSSTAKQDEVNGSINKYSGVKEVND